MSQVSYRANLSAATFPITLAKAGRSVIVPGPDNNFDRRVDPEGAQKDAGIPQLIYGEDILPTPQGYQSIGYVDQSNIPIPIGETITGIKRIKSAISATSIGTVTLISFSGGSVISDRFGLLNNWGAITWVGASSSDVGAATWAIVAGVCYVFFPGTGRLYTATLGGASQLTLTDITASVLPVGFFTGLDKKGITGAYNYLVTFTKTTAYWSSTTTPTDFTASLVTGAGSSGINSTFSLLTAIAPHPTGFYLYTGSNVISAKYTGNRLYPWQFSPIKNSQAVGFFDYDLSADFHVGVESDGTVKLIYPSESTPVAPELVQLFDWSTSVLDVFNPATNTFSLEQLTQNFGTVGVVGRYITLSYHPFISAGIIQYYRKALVFDTVLRRYGRFKIDHTGIFKLENTFGIVNNVTGICTYVSKDMYNLLAPTGTRRSHAGVLVLGRFQYVRSRFLCLDEFEVEATQDTTIQSPNFEVKVLPSLDGKNFDTPVTPALRSISGNLAKYACLAEGKNVTLVIKGAFDLTSLDMKFHVGGGW